MHVDPLPSPDVGVGSEGQIQLSKEHDHAAYQIMGMTNAATGEHIFCS